MWCICILTGCCHKSQRNKKRENPHLVMSVAILVFDITMTNSTGYIRVHVIYLAIWELTDAFFKAMALLLSNRRIPTSV